MTRERFLRIQPRLLSASVLLLAVLAVLTALADVRRGSANFCDF
jgi:hypothetical protein